MQFTRHLPIGIALVAAVALLGAPSEGLADTREFAPHGAVTLVSDSRSPKPMAPGVAPQATPKPTPQPAPRVLRFVPPSTDRPAVRLRSASSRGPEESLPGLYALSPEDTGLTVSAQPSLFWYLDETPPLGSKMVFTLIDEAQDDPVLELPFAAPERPGIYRIELADHAVTLDPGVEYEWSVSLVVDSEQWSRNPYAIAGIERVSAPDALASRLSADGCAGQAEIYAELGLWYDAFASASDIIASAPDEHPSEIRAALLRQVGLEEIAH